MSYPCVESPSNRNMFTYKPAQDREQTQMVGQESIVLPSVGATGRKGGLTNTTLRPSNKSPTMDSEWSKALNRMSFSSKPLRADASGFTSNQKPAIYYKPSLDLIDNPQFGILLSDSYMSLTKQHYQPPLLSDGSRSLPSLFNKPKTSGFHHVRSVPKTEPVEEKSEYKRLFRPHRLTPSVSYHMNVGPKLETGFTEGTNLQLNTFRDKKRCTAEPCQTYCSVMKRDFLAPSFIQPTVCVPSVRSHSYKETGYTRGGMAPLACPSSLLPSPETRSDAPAVKIIGKKEPTGFTSNAPNDIFQKRPFDPSHFATHYNSKFCRGYQDRKSVYAARIINKSHTMENSYNCRDTDKFMLYS